MILQVRCAALLWVYSVGADKFDKVPRSCVCSIVWNGSTESMLPDCCKPCGLLVDNKCFTITELSYTRKTMGVISHRLAISMSDCTVADRIVLTYVP